MLLGICYVVASDKSRLSAHFFFHATCFDIYLYAAVGAVLGYVTGVLIGGIFLLADYMRTGLKWLTTGKLRATPAAAKEDSTSVP